MRITPASEAGVDVNVGETLSSRGGNTSSQSSVSVIDNLIIDAQDFELVVRCDCGIVIKSGYDHELIELVQRHWDDFHPNLGVKVPPNFIMAMAEIKETEK
jgi:hypothetical protein